MKRYLYAALFVIVAVLLNACASGRAANVSVSDVQQFVSAKTANVTIVDVNDDETRRDKGMVPGATRLSSYDKYAMSELPADKNSTVIFYCYNSLCPASALAADRAIDAGYKDVRVMKAGIVGWKAATAALEKNKK
jgi:rhodanese-related sulfurtransferase